jgi:DNA repair protein RadA/Sms
MTRAYLSDRAIPRRVSGDITLIGVRTLGDVLQKTVGKDAT